MADDGLRREIWIWQNVLSPHMAALAAALAANGHRVKYIAQQLSLEERSELGWTVPKLGHAELVHCPTPQALEAQARSAHAGMEHIFQGFRGNGHLSQAYRSLGCRNIPFWVFLEMVDNRGWKGVARRAYYRHMFTRWNPHLRGVLAVGGSMQQWVMARGIPKARTHPFTYFLPDATLKLSAARSSAKPYQIMFVGKLIERKGLDILLMAMSELISSGHGAQLVVVGAGPKEQELKDMTERLGVSPLVNWLGSRKIDEIPELMATADLLVLPSRYDGWGAVVTEALMAGTPAITTDRCGAAEAVRDSGCGAVVPSENIKALRDAIAVELEWGPVPAEFRLQLAGWAHAFSAEQGAAYLSAVFDAEADSTSAPPPPWKTAPPPARTEPNTRLRSGKSQIK